MEKDLLNKVDPFFQVRMILELKMKCNHMNGIDFEALEKELWDHNALDISKIPLYGNSGFLLSVLIKPEEEETILSILRKYDTTSAIEKYTFERTTLSRKKEYVKDQDKVLSIKISTKSSTDNKERSKPYNLENQLSAKESIYNRKWEYEELAEYAKSKHISIREAREFWDTVYQNK